MKGISKKVIVMIIIFSILVLLCIFCAFYTFFANKKDDVVKAFDSGAVLMTYKTEDNTFLVSDFKSYTDEEGKKLGEEYYYEFSVSTSLEDSEEIAYEISLIKDKELSTLKDSDIKIYLEQQESGSFVEVMPPTNYSAIDKQSKFGSEKGSMVLANVVKKKDSVDNYRLRVWVAEGVTITNEDGVIPSCVLKVNVNGKAY